MVTYMPWLALVAPVAAAILTLIVISHRRRRDLKHGAILHERKADAPLPRVSTSRT